MKNRKRKTPMKAARVVLLSGETLNNQFPIRRQTNNSAPAREI
jgi:hypothetical protein